MPKKLSEANVTVPEYPRTRFIRTAPPGSTPAFQDVTLSVASILIETTDTRPDECALVRLDAKGDTVWRTIHPSEIEARWQATHEYCLEDAEWTVCS
ncbi:MAG: hypothetical protein WCT04_27345 [Planctomycetota bacterium]